MAGMLWIGVHGSSSQDAWASCWAASDDVLALGLEDGVALRPSGKVPTVSSRTPHGCGRDLTFLTVLQVSE